MDLDETYKIVKERIDNLTGDEINKLNEELKKSNERPHILEYK